MTSVAQTKPLVKSTTFWGIITSVLPVLANLYDYTAGLPVASLSPQIAGAVTIAGAILAMFGRINATKPIKGVVSKKK